MSIARKAEIDRTAGVAPAIRTLAPWRVVKVKVLPEHRIKVAFVDGLKGVVDLSGLVSSPQAGVFAALRDRAVFEEAAIVLGAVTWPGDIDLAPDAMYDAIRKDGTWVLS